MNGDIQSGESETGVVEMEGKVGRVLSDVAQDGLENWRDASAPGCRLGPDHRRPYMLKDFIALGSH